MRRAANILAGDTFQDYFTQLHGQFSLMERSSEHSLAPKDPLHFQACVAKIDALITYADNIRKSPEPIMSVMAQNRLAALREAEWCFEYAMKLGSSQEHTSLGKLFMSWGDTTLQLLPVAGSQLGVSAANYYGEAMKYAKSVDEDKYFEATCKKALANVIANPDARKELQKLTRNENVHEVLGEAVEDGLVTEDQLMELLG